MVDYLADRLLHTAIDQRLQSYLSILRHANQYALSQVLRNAYAVRPGLRIAA